MARIITSAAVLSVVLDLACGRAARPAQTPMTVEPPRATAASPTDAASLPADTATPDAPTRTGASAGCVVVQGDFAPQPTSIEGVLVKSTNPGAAPFVLRLARPRCVVGLERGSLLTEVYVASTAADLRPLVGARLKITGDAIAGSNDLGGPAVIVLARDVERLLPADEP